MLTTLSSPMMATLLAILFLTLLHMPQLSSAAPGDFFNFQRFSSSQLRQRLGLDQREVTERESSSAAQTGKPAFSLAPNHSAVAGGQSNANADALRGVRKLLFGTLSCAPQDLSLTQGPVSSTSGIPTFNVQIVNLCGACAMADIHVACGNWASATPVDPFVFTRLGYNDCLVNNGQPLSSQGSVSFQYSNSAMYPMSIATATNECSR